MFCTEKVRKNDFALMHLGEKDAPHTVLFDAERMLFIDLTVDVQPV